MRSVRSEAAAAAQRSVKCKVLSGFASRKFSNRRIIAACRQCALPTSIPWPSLKHWIITRESACYSARATSAPASTSGADLARWLTALCRFNSFDRRGGDSLIKCVCGGTASSCPIKVRPAAATSSRGRETVFHRVAEPKRMCASDGNTNIAPGTSSKPLAYSCCLGCLIKPITNCLGSTAELLDEAASEEAGAEKSGV